MSRPVRVLISKIGLDGHDRGAKLIVRNLRDAGMDVIYTGLWQTPAATVHAALQEDVDVLGISLLSAAHMTIIPEVVRLCREAGIGDTPLIVGGIIPEQDKQPLRDAGCAGVFNPGTPMNTIVEVVRELALRKQAARHREAPPALSTIAGVARAITFIVEGRAAELRLPGATPHSAIVLGVTGAPGVGKSTFIGKLARTLRGRQHRVAVVAVDPTSPLSGGSVLGDRLRMMSTEPDDGLYVRSLSSAGQSGGLAPNCDRIVALLRAAGFEFILLETVGAGQNDVDVRTLSDRVLLVLMPGAGDTVQFQKAGVVEVAHAFAVNKADLDGADRTIQELRESLEDDRPIWAVSALRNEGLEAVAAWAESLPR